MRSKRYLIWVVLAVIFAAGLAGCTEDVEEAQTRVLHDKSTEVAEVTETTVSETPATEPDAKAIQPATKTTAAKANATNPVKQKTTENKPTKQVAKPVHTHCWQPVYATRTVTDYKKVCITRCSACGADITGHASEHRKQEAMAGNNAGSYETYETVACGSHTEQYFTGYKCNCGATK